MENVQVLMKEKIAQKQMNVLLDFFVIKILRNALSKKVKEELAKKDGIAKIIWLVIEEDVLN